jgi:hypothetical protein
VAGIGVDVIAGAMTTRPTHRAAKLVAVLVALTMAASVLRAESPDRDGPDEPAAGASVALPVGTVAALPAPRPALLPTLYLTLAGLQVFDIASTSRALRSGGAEANPIMTDVVGSPAAMIGVKAAATATAILAAEHLRKHNRAAAIATMVAVNSAFAMVVSHNYAVARH